MKAVLLVLASLLAGTMAQSTTSCPDGAACDANTAKPMDDHDHSHDHGHGHEHEHEHEHEHDHDHDHEAGTGTLAPSPTNSGDCHPHGDHWHCEGVAETGAPAVAGRVRGGMGAVAAVAFAALGM